jgi:hypothetical protein
MPASTIKNRYGHGFLNGCETCGEDFASVKYFDAHRVGTLQYLLRQGLAMDPPRENGRRCLDEDEMRDKKGWERDGRGRWIDPKKAERTGSHFGRPAMRARNLSPSEASGVGGPRP